MANLKTYRFADDDIARMRAQEALAEDPFSGAVIVYRAKRSDRIKILVWDTSGLVLIWKYLVSH